MVAAGLPHGAGLDAMARIEDTSSSVWEAGDEDGRPEGQTRMLKILKYMLNNIEISARLYWQSTLIKPIFFSRGFG